MRIFSLVLLVLVLGLGGANWVLQGPLPLDFEITRLLQTVVDARSVWIDGLSQTAGWPLIVVSTLVAGLFAASLARLPGAAALIGGVILAMASERLLRLAIDVPRPSAELVEVAKASASSGLPSTFAIFYGAACGGLILLARRKRGREAMSVQVVAWALLVIGCAGRVAAGAHWTSQVVASAALGALAAILAARLAGLQTRGARR
ncbi:phosphatase PAP2 family protein [Blastomonas sp.]|uniref:phosphatase PAP2 family protein n=1 Tax=Blastomonas sp. TaxID=1909299 RepID=UPI002636B2B0|nr:phosphatase PAP2 family protein [Blastomonas sp.]MDM7957889.1 phosphatase PAP2 family protein [Blastomonas sp.]